MRTIVKDARGATLGYINEDGSRKTLYDTAGAMLGWYNEGQNRTYDRNGVMIGYGDQLTRLLKD
jgi:YD repeat-containing protein